MDNQTVALTELDLFCCELLHQIVSSASSEDPAVEERLFSSPTGGRDGSFEKDWREYVEPDLRRIFQTHLEVVAGDLENFPPEEAQGDCTLHIPFTHLEAWIHSLNQARLALVAEHNITGRELMRARIRTGDRRSIALAQLRFYEFILAYFLFEVDGLA